MRKLSKIAAATLVAATMTTGAFAAQTTGTINATVEVIAALTLTETNAMDFGQIVTSETAVQTIAVPADCTNATAVSAGNGAAQITNASDGQAVNVTVGFPATLDDGGGNSITFQNGTAQYCDTEAGAVVDVTTAATAVTLVADAGGNENIIYTAGELAPDGTQAIGTYNGTIDITLDY
jgi:spore coat protein U-like protein